LGADHLEALSALATHGFRPDRLDLFVFDSVLYVHASHKLPFGRWVNVVAETPGGGDGFPSLRMKIGSVPLSPYASRLLISTLRAGMGLTGAEIPALDDLVRQLVVQEDRLAITINLPNKMGVLDGVLGAQNNVNPTLVVEAYCRLARAQKLSPQTDFAMQVRRAFPADHTAQATSESNSAAFVALAMAIVDKRVGSLAGVNASQLDACQMPEIPIMLHGRHDLSKHWALSAALSVGSGTQISEAMGEWKELADSLTKQSKFQPGDPTGFSFVDISADRSGFRTADAASNEALAGKMAARLARVTQNEILPRSLLSLEEGPAVDFAQKYGSLEDPRFTEAIRNINSVLDQEGLLRP